MKTIKIFLAASEELENDRNAFGNLIRRLDNIYEQRGIRIKLFEWEDYDAAYNNCRKQDEYNEKVKACDIFLAFFHTKAGQFTIEEFNVASEKFKKQASPKIYTYFKDLQSDEQESHELTLFKKKLFDELGYYWCKYNNKDTMQLHFIMQLQLVENQSPNILEIHNGQVTFDGISIARIDKLPFIANNAEFQQMNDEIMKLPIKIDKKRQQLKKNPEDEFIKEELQELLNHYNKLKKSFIQYQQLLFTTAKRITYLQNRKITDRIRRAINAFNDGEVHKANVILDEAEKDANQNLQNYKQSYEQTKQIRQSVILSIEELLFKIDTLMADVSYNIEVRVSKAIKYYKVIDEMAIVIDLNKKDHDNILYSYAYFLYKYAYYKQSIEIFLREIFLRETLYGTNKFILSLSYNSLGCAYDQIGAYKEALKYYKKSQKIKETILGKNNVNMATTYSNIGSIYRRIGLYKKALEFYQKALNLQKTMTETKNPDIASFYSNIGGIFYDYGKFDEALTYYNKAALLREHFFGRNHPIIAESYNNIGSIYRKKGLFETALQYHNKAIIIQKRTIGERHSDTANTYNCIGLVFHKQGVYEKALDYFNMALNIFLKIHKNIHPDISMSYNNIGLVYYKQNKLDLSLSYLNKGLEIACKQLNQAHPIIANSYNNIGNVLLSQKKYNEALSFYNKALKIRIKKFTTKHPDTANSYNNIGHLYYIQGIYDKALKYYEKAASILEYTIGDELNTASTYFNIGLVYTKIGEHLNALIFTKKALEIKKCLLGEKHIETANLYNYLGHIYFKLQDNQKALQYFNKTLEIWENSFDKELPKMQVLIKNITLLTKPGEK